MKKRCFLLPAFCLAITLFCLAENVTAAPAVSRDAFKPQSTVNEAQYWPIAERYHNKDEVWPPAAGRYERKNPNGLCNAYINVTVLPDQWPVVNLHACEYNGPNDEHGWEALDTNPGIWMGGSIQPAQMGLAARFIVGAKTIGMYRGNGIPEMLPNQKIFMNNSGVKSLKNRIIIGYPGDKVTGLPDVRGEYVLNKTAPAVADEYSAYALIENMLRNETKTDFFDKNLQIKPQVITGNEAAPYKNLIGDSGFAVKVFQNGALIRTFIVPQDLSAVYRFESNGNSVMIYNIDGSKG